MSESSRLGIEDCVDQQINSPWVGKLGVKLLAQSFKENLSSLVPIEYSTLNGMLFYLFDQLDS